MDAKYRILSLGIILLQLEIWILIYIWMDKGLRDRKKRGILDASEEFIYCYGNRYILATAAWYVADMQSLSPQTREK